MICFNILAPRRNALCILHFRNQRIAFLAPHRNALCFFHPRIKKDRQWFFCTPSPCVVRCPLKTCITDNDFSTPSQCVVHLRTKQNRQGLQHPITMLYPLKACTKQQTIIFAPRRNALCFPFSYDSTEQTQVFCTSTGGLNLLEAHVTWSSL